MAISRYVVTSTVTIGAGVIGSTPVEVAPSNPGVGLGYTYTVSGASNQMLATATFTITTSATAGTRYPFVKVMDSSGNTVAQQSNLTGIAASLSSTMDLALGSAGVPNAASGTAVGSLPQVELGPGWQISIGASGLLAGDQISGIFLTFLETAEESEQAATGSSSAAPGAGTYGLWPVTLLRGSVLLADPAGQLYTAIGAGNLRAWVDGQDTVGHAALSN